MTTVGEEGPGDRRKRRDLLSMYYGKSGEPGKEATSSDQLDIDGPGFDPDTFFTRLVKEKSLTDLMKKEDELLNQITTLDSEMQTLVYENYDKFIKATETIRQMKQDFRNMEEEMTKLSTAMNSITKSSEDIERTLRDRKQEISKLASVHVLLKKLQFLFELPNRLKQAMEAQAYGQAVRYYIQARKLLEQYGEISSFKKISEECNEIVSQVAGILKAKFRNEECTPQQLNECIELLLHLKEPADLLCDEYLIRAKVKIDADLDELHRQIVLMETIKEQISTDLPADILEFVDIGCNGFISDLSLVIASYQELFIHRFQSNVELSRAASNKLIEFVQKSFNRYFDYVEKRVGFEKETGDNTLLVRALDRFYRRLQAMNKLLPTVDFTESGTQIVYRAACGRVSHYFESLKQYFAACLTDIRQALAAQQASARNQRSLSDFLDNLQKSFIDQLKATLTNLQAFVASDITFCARPVFRQPFCTQQVREGFVVRMFQHIFQHATNCCEMTSEKSSIPAPLLLILSKLCLDFSTSTIQYMVVLVEEQFFIQNKAGLTSISELCRESKETAQKLLTHYVRLEGTVVSQMIRKSIDTRDWVNTIEPRNVRAVMKRVVEDITAIDIKVGQLYEEGSRKEQSSDSSKRTAASRQMGRTIASFTPSTIDPSVINNINKLFSERIEIFSEIDFNKVSVLTGIIKISLKTFLECVRLRTFGKYGLQQTQVDTHYLYTYLWRFVSDENLISFLLDEIVNSTLQRCVDPVPMEPSVIECICDRG